MKNNKKVPKMLYYIVAIIACMLMPSTTFTTVASASIIKSSGDITSHVKSIALESDMVKDVSVITFGTNIGIALRCDNIYFQQDKNSVKSEIIKKVKEAYPEFTKIMIKLDLDIFIKTKAIEDKLASGESMYSLRNDIIEVMRLADSRE